MLRMKDFNFDKPPKPVVLECAGCKADIRESQVYACVTLSFESMDPITLKDLTPDHYSNHDKLNEKRKSLGEPELEQSEYIVDVRDAEQLAAFCMTCAERMGLTKARAGIPQLLASLIGCLGSDR